MDNCKTCKLCNKDRLDFVCGTCNTGYCDNCATSETICSTCNVYVDVVQDSICACSCCSTEYLMHHALDKCDFCNKFACDSCLIDGECTTCESARIDKKIISDKIETCAECGTSVFYSDVICDACALDYAEKCNEQIRVIEQQEQPCCEPTCKTLLEINDIYMQRARVSLTDRYKLDFDKFIDCVIRNNITISGSFVLETVLDTRYSDSDLDIFCDDSAYEELKLLLCNYKQKTTRQSNKTVNINYIDKWVTRKAASDNRETIQITVIPRDMIAAHIASFNLSVSRNVFDGCTFTVHDAAVNMTCYARTLNRPEDIKKYAARGFVIYVEVSPYLLDLSWIYRDTETETDSD